MTGGVRCLWPGNGDAMRVLNRVFGREFDDPESCLSFPAPARSS